MPRLLLATLAAACSLAGAASPAVRVAVVSDQTGGFLSFLQRFPFQVERWQWNDLESRSFDGIDALYLLAGTHDETLAKPARTISRELAFKLHSFTQKGGGFYVEGVTPTSSPTMELLGFKRNTGIHSVGILKVVKPQASPHWITASFPDDQIWQVRGVSYFDGSKSWNSDQIVLELAPAVGTYRIFRTAEGKRIPALIASFATEGRGYYATLPLSEFRDQGYGPRAAWEQLLERVVLAPLSPETRERMLREKLTLKAWTEPRTWALPGSQLNLVAECRPDADLRVSGLPESKLEWKTDSESRRRANIRLPEGDYRIQLQATWQGRRTEQEVALVVAPRQTWYRRALDRNMNWFLRSGLLPAPDGSKGVLEGFDSVNYALNGSLRTDCLTQAGLAFYLYGRLAGDPAWTQRGENVLAYVFRQSFQDQDTSRPTFGFWNFFDTLRDYPLAIYTDDNSWAAYAMLRMYQITGRDDYLARGLQTVDGFVDTQTASGLRIARIEGPELLQRGRPWYVAHGKPSNDPHYVSNGDMAVLLAYHITKDKKYLDSARRSIDAMAAAFPNFATRTSLTRATQFALFLSSPTLLYRATGEEKYRDLFGKVLAELRAHQHESGAIAEWGSFSRENFGGEGPLITLEGEPLSDQLYTTSFALLNLREACFLLRNGDACDSFLRLADYLTRIQIRSPDTRLDGAWNRSFDFHNWEIYGSNSDPAWGPYSMESGWTNTIISIALADYLSRRSAFATAAPDRFEGRHYRGRGDLRYLQLLDIARRMFEPDPEFQNLSMLYTPRWNGLVEGPTWDAWWIQNSYGTTYCALPFFQEPFVTFLQNSQDLWFSQMGDGKREGCPGHPKISWVAPDGQLCDAALPGCAIYKQGDGRIGIHDWGLEFTAAGLLLQAEHLLITRDTKAIARYLPLLERAANFLDTRRDPANNLFLAGPAANLLAPSYAGWRRPDGAYGQAYLAGLSITYIAALDRLLELEKLAGATAQVRLYTQRRNLARQGLPLLTTPEGYFIKSLDPDGTKHGVFGAAKHGYFEASPNHDAICFRVADTAQTEKIYAKIASIPQLRLHRFILPNYPSLDDMYEEPKGLWRFGHWVNGGHWSTCEARMIMAYYRLGRFQDARLSFEQLLAFARRFRLDNPLTNFGSDVYQPKQPINITYDAFGPPAALIRGLFEYLYRADGLTLLPHIPPTITELHQLDPIRFGKKKLFLSTLGQGPIRSVKVNGKTWKAFDNTSVFLPYDKTPDTARILIVFDSAKRIQPSLPDTPSLEAPLPKSASWLQAFYDRLVAAGFTDSYEAAHARLALQAARAIDERHRLQAAAELPQLPEPSQTAADQSYLEAATRLSDGLETVLKSHATSRDPHSQEIYRFYRRPR